MPATASAPLHRYALFDRIGSGGMATVHLGRVVGAAGFARTVAIKRLHPHLADDPSFVSMFVDEARLAARIHHPNVVHTLDVVARKGELLIVMEYVEGASLSRLWRAEQEGGQRIALPVASAIVCGLLHGLHAAHGAKDAGGMPLGLVHRDVSPQNVIVGVDGAARVLDFGVAKAIGRLQTTREGMVKGKLGYMAPEQARGVEVGPATDVYAAAVVLWELITGRRLFAATSDAEMLLDVLSASHQAPGRLVTGVPYALDTLVMRGLASRPGGRFPTARAMADALARAVPPAQPHEVGAWVERIVGAELVTRRTRISEIESDAGAAPPASNPWPRDEAEKSQPSSVSVATPRGTGGSRSSRSGSRLSLIAAAGIGAGIAAIGTALLLGGRGRPDAAGSSSAPAPTIAVTAAASTASSTPAALPLELGVTTLVGPVASDMIDEPPTASAPSPTPAPSSRPKSAAPSRVQPAPRPHGSAAPLPPTLPLSPD